MSDAQKKAVERYRKKNKEELNEKARRYHKMCRAHNRWRENIAAYEMTHGITSPERDTFFYHECKEHRCYE